jgi:hypothetical protein
MPDPASTAKAADDVVATAIPKVDEKTGAPMDGQWPHNHRLRAEAMAKAGLDKDPDGMIPPALILDAAERIAAEEAWEAELAEAELAARPPVNASMKVADLERIARNEEVDLTGARNNEERVQRIEASRAPPPPLAPAAGAGLETETTEA